MYLGIEIGGTKLQVGVGPGDGTIARLWRGAVDVAAGAGGGLIIDRKIYRGTGKGAAEVGHLRLYQLALADQPEGGYLKLEDSASGWAIQRTAQYWLESGPQLKAVFRRSSLTKLPEG